MSSCSSRALTILSTVFGACGLLLVGVAVSTDYWLIMVEGIILQQNQSMEVKMALHSGLWRVCFVAGAENGRCVASEYFTEPDIEITTENTANILKMVRTATPFPMVSLLFVFTAFVISNIGHIRPQRTILAFVSGIFFILSGLSLVVGLVLYISSINDEVMNRPREPEQFFNYYYGWSFAFAASSFLLKEVSLCGCVCVREIIWGKIKTLCVFVWLFSYIFYTQGIYFHFYHIWDFSRSTAC
uniref:Voltage-dependent calcium channel gamma-7 subunit n=1 Tax=Scophthalmus maximus TaxID=52904 RepID=A0A8D3AMZ5_SCOMX